jgi:hypothetical protein
MTRGIDYGLGRTNIDHATGIRYGVIPQNDVLQSWADASNADYGPASCGECGNEAVSIDADGVPDLDAPCARWPGHPEDSADDCNCERLAEWRDEGREFACLECARSFDSDDAYGEEPLRFYLDDGEYVAQQGGDDSDVFIIRSPYYTFGPFCSPCAPGAIYLRDGGGDGEKAYCFAPDWFSVGDGDATGEYAGEETSCPYPVFRVNDGECVFRPKAN